MPYKIKSQKPVQSKCDQITLFIAVCPLESDAMVIRWLRGTRDSVLRPEDAHMVIAI